MIYRNINKVICLCILCLPASVRALSSDREQPIFIEAEEVELDKQKGISRYHGNVRFRQGSLVIHGGTILLYHKDGQVEKVIINGQPASFQQQPDKGETTIVSQARKMEYIASRSRLFLYDNAQVSQGKNSFSGEKIEYDIIKGTVVANKNSSGKNRINAILEPDDTAEQSP